MSFISDLQRYNPFRAKEKIELQAVEGNNIYEFDYSQIGYQRTEDPNILNQFRSYGSQISAIEEKYNNRDTFGNSLTRTIIKYLATWKLSRRLTISSDDKKTQEYLDRFIEYNNIPLLANKISILGEKQGNLLVVNNFEKVDGELQVKLLPLKYIRYNYRVYLDNSYKIEYCQYNTLDKTEKLNPDRFEFLLLNGDIEDQKGGICTPPTTGFILSDIDMIERLRVLRYKAIKLFASGTPVFEVEDENTRTLLNDWIKKTKWKVGTSVVLKNGKFSIVGMDINGIDAIDKAIFDHNTNISATTGIPMFLLGHSEQAKYDNAEAQVESLNALMGSDRILYEQFFRNLIMKGIVSYNKLTGSSLIPESVDVVNPPVSRSEIKLLLAHYDMMRDRGDMPLDLYLQEDPFIEDPKEWMKAIKKDEKAKQQKMTDRMNQLMANADNTQIPTEDTSNANSKDEQL